MHVNRIHLGDSRLAKAGAMISAMAAVATAGLLAIGAPAHAQPAAGSPGSPFAQKTADPDHDGDPDLRAVCTAAPHRGQVACFAVKVTDMDTYVGPRAAAGGDALRPFMPSGYSPSLLRRAYRLPSARGSGRTVAVVDAYNDSHAASDLATYRRTFGLPACTAASGCFRKVNQTGGTSYPKADSSWSSEISLDLDMVSAICPHCRILLVEASSAGISDLGTAVNTAVRFGAKYVSNSYGASESSADTRYDRRYFDHPGVMITASAGDGGYATSYPAASRYVTAVGGTTLKPASNARGFTETAWGDNGSGGGGSGCSTHDAKPSWQTDRGCGTRTATDVAAVADPDTGVAVYDLGWAIYGEPRHPRRSSPPPTHSPESRKPAPTRPPTRTGTPPPPCTT